MRQLLLPAAIAASVLFGGCSRQDVYAQLSQRQANEMVALLRGAGVEADKEPRDAGLFVVTAPREEFTQAVELLRANGYPREGHDSLGQVFKKEGFVSSPLEERARLTHALSNEIANTLSSIDGVVVARVHLSVPERDPLAEKAPESSASVFIKHRSGVDLTSQQAQIKALVVNAIQGLSYDKVTVVLFPAEPWPVQRRAVAAGIGGLASPLWLAAGLGGVGLVGGAALWTSQRRRPERRTHLSVAAAGKPRKGHDT